MRRRDDRPLTLTEAVHSVSPPRVLLAEGERELRGDDQTYEEARWLGATAILDRPFDLDELRTLVLTLVPPRWFR